MAFKINFPDMGESVYAVMFEEPVNGVVGYYIRDLTKRISQMRSQWSHFGLGKSDMFERGYLNGYVILTEDNPLWGKSYSDDDFPDLEVHGGVTWSEELPDYLQYDFCGSDLANLWTLGFDTAHFGDTAEEWDFKSVEKETLNFVEVLRNYKGN